MNAFALALLAYPFYLMVNGRFVSYVALATTAASGLQAYGGASGSFAPIPLVTTEQPLTTDTGASGSY